ncbi:MAG: bifunctional methylenetetrahydrofolate dehydrogenase/methenyltetrahydrofolate cyclohydrolase FolD [Gammaproteobacteria bacterium]|jgi:methylenetetrahydrofolate dehydrogenase (NADP+)/methenyltetrahydrofolate cyclohydrolase|nr:bifunctional methylenetetrahydrofolate dehydrogenase/methenyltetrahydrofolate cyclohydrolase FolD [Gammaproteobacteria bacterium]MBT5217593.1 bifunctional methylenetetrahydrofolate dehydrogenase/methenyltetrahydrofolate cyclohydrolase FolD [Gammaproteobacteria bacterium]MBT5542624.1 bifunctional methylenetetrahydrofolate dehydrogenase/methenyltetrahydrofolate cyclohydrolase FolD [Gammaproteobacteria bacterium]MBT7753756.1 bifunctional methylenetetrahydrofolate dehydrogenase/methenyltetrahydro
MTANIIDGKKIAQETISEIKNSIAVNIEEGLSPPGLAVIIVGDNPASSIYVRNKRTACKEAGIKSYDHDLPKNISEKELIELIQALNTNPNIHGILVQLPLPDHINETKIIESIEPIKDVDGFHPYTIGRLMQRIPVLRPCTSIGVITMLDSIGVNPMGKHAVIVGASNLVGRPLALELLLKGATTTVCHKFTKDLESFVNQADILAVAVGKAGIIPGHWVKNGAVVFDIGINRDKNGKVTGDVDFEVAKEKASWISPVPGGVGPMTVAMLLKNTLIASNMNTSVSKKERKISSDKWINI